MSAGIRVARETALRVADALAGELVPACHRITVAGSLRRGVPEVGDIELVAEPLIERSSAVPLWDDAEEQPEVLTRNLLAELLDRLISAGTLAPHPTDPKRGARYAKFVHVPSGLQLDLFSVLPPAQYGAILVIRTGPAHWSQHLMGAAKGRNLHFAEGALHEGSTHATITPCRIVPTPSELEVFEALRMPYLAPEDRR